MRTDFKDYARLTLDMDSHVETVYGNQQRAKAGYNPKKPGRKGFHPLFCFIGETRDFLWGKFRPGNRYTGQGVAGFHRAAGNTQANPATGARGGGEAGVGLIRYSVRRSLLTAIALGESIPFPALGLA